MALVVRHAQLTLFVAMVKLPAANLVIIMMDLIVPNAQLALYLELGQANLANLALAMLFVITVLLVVANLGITDLHAFNVRLG